MAIVNFPSNTRKNHSKSRAVVPVEVQMLDASGQLGLFCLIHLVAGLALWTSIVAAISLWVALNARSLQESDATLGQRTYGLRLGVGEGLPLKSVVTYAFVVSGLGIMAWLVDVVLSSTIGITLSRFITGYDLELSDDPGLFA